MNLYSVLIAYDVATDIASKIAGFILLAKFSDSFFKFLNAFFPNNPNTGNMSNMLQNISSEWKTLFDQQVKQSGEKDKLNSLVQLRNDFAHGDSISVSIDTVIKYFDSAVKILNILDNVCT